MSAKPFAVVEFTKEASVGIVHESWIVINPKTKAIYCYWPKGQPNVSVSKKVRRGEMPDKENWSKQEIRIFCYTGTFTDALLRSQKAEVTSSVETEEEEEESRKRKRKAPRAFTSSDSEASPPRRKSPRKALVHVYEDPSRPSLPKAPNPCRSGDKQADRPSLPKSPVLDLYYDNSSDNGVDNDADDFPICSTPQSSTPILSSGLRSPPVPATPINSGNQDAEGVNRSSVQSASGSGGALKLILTKLSILQQNQNEILSAIRNLTQRHAQENVAVAATACELDEICQKPAETEGELLDLNEKVKDELIRKKLSQYYCTFGGKDVDTTCRLVMSFTGSNKVWSMYSLKGKRGKKKLEDLAICRPILTALMKTHKVTRKEAEDAITEFLKHAPFKKGGSKFKKGVTSSAVQDLEAGENLDLDD